MTAAEKRQLELWTRYVTGGEYVLEWKGNKYTLYRGGKKLFSMAAATYPDTLDFLILYLEMYCDKARKIINGGLDRPEKCANM